MFTSGCWELREINETAVVTGIGVDLNDNEQIAFSVQVAEPSVSGESGTDDSQSIVFTSSGSTVSEAARKNLLYMPHLPLWSHATTIILGDKLVQDDLSVLIDTLSRNYNLRPEITILVASHTSPDQVLNVPLPLRRFSGKNFGNLLKIQEMQLGIYVPIAMNEFISKLAIPGIEPAVPLVAIKPEGQKEQLILQGMAVFKGPQMVGSLNEVESRGYRWLNSTINRGGILLISSPLNKEDNITLEISHFKHKTRPHLNMGKLKMVIEVEADLIFYEQNGTNELLDLESTKLVEELARQQIEKEISSCITKSQSLQSDILGWGRTVNRYQPNEWKRLGSEWPRIFPGMESEIKVKTRVTRTTLSIKSFQFK
jgi:Ger(x)C family germination protein